MALTESDRKILVKMIREDIRQEMRADEQASMPHAGDVGPPTEGEETNKLLTGIADKLNSMHKRLDALEKDEPEEDLKNEGRTKSIEELKELADAMGSNEGTIQMPGEPKPVVADSDFYNNLRKEPDHIIDAKIRQTIAAIQARADKIYSMRNDSAPKAMQGEGPYDYKRRLIQPLKKYSPAFKDVDLAQVPNGPAFNAIEAQVMADAETALKDPRNFIGEGDDLYERKTRDASGREISEFFSNIGPSTWMRQFAGGTPRRLIGIRCRNND